MEPVEFWALEQFNRVLQSTEKLALEFWDDSGELLEALRYSKLLASREVERNVRNLIQYYVYRLEVDPGSDSQFKSDPEHFIRLYKDPVLKKEDPALFGYTFCALLRAEQDSALWKCLTRDERLQLFAALVYLTPLPSTLPTSWIQHTSEVSEAVNTDSRNGCFDACAKSFLNHFSNGLTCSKLNSDSLRSGVAEVLELADRRLSLERKFRSAECTCAEQLLEVVDLNMNTLFAEITEKYHGCLE
ncbi:hypothetical protein FRC07_011248 [Ceratobasidium sp. 392]|nr:hypothetical protein FRC07_011248 [Ceratobasidium sp. 392]